MRVRVGVMVVVEVVVLVRLIGSAGGHRCRWKGVMGSDGVLCLDGALGVAQDTWCIGSLASRGRTVLVSM